MGKRVVEGLLAAIEAANQRWQVNFRSGFISFLRAGGYKVMVVDLVRNRPVRLGIRLPSGEDPASLGLTNPFPELPTVWDAFAHEWGWHIASAGNVPNPDDVVRLADQYAGRAADDSPDEN